MTTPGDPVEPGRRGGAGDVNKANPRSAAPSHTGDADGSSDPTYTIVSFHAHPDDEALLTAGSLAKAAAAGHRVVIVVATAGEAGLAAAGRQDTGDHSGDPGVEGRDGGGGSLGERRIGELNASARAIGCTRVVLLGYADSGYHGEQSADPVSFARADLEVAARRLAAVLDEEAADVVTIYDPAGGYGHADHVQVHRVGVRAAALAATPVVLEATIDRELLRRVAAVVKRLQWIAPGLDIPDLDQSYTARRDLTHRIDVREFLVAKRAAIAAHSSQATSDSGTRLLQLLLRLPRPVFRLVCGTEWFVERGRPPGAQPSTDLFASLPE
ncbi:MAG: PIG-L family deacetylase [Nocardioidaceae bacterium]